MCIGMKYMTSCICLFANLYNLSLAGWNALSYLWGVFRVRRTNYSEYVPTSHIQLSVPCLNVLPSDHDMSISSSQQLFQILFTTKIALQELQHISFGRRTSFDQKPSRVDMISCSGAPIGGEQLSNDMLQTNISLVILVSGLQSLVGFN